MGAVLIPSVALAGLAGVDLAVASPVECASVLSNSRLVRGWLDAVEARATARLTEHHAAGHSAPAADTHTKCGGVSAAEARRKERRSKTINDAPGFGDALAGGDIGAEHVDQLAAATARLDDTVKAALLDDQEDLLEAACSQTPEQFGQTVRDKARTLEADHGIERNKQQRKQTFISHRVNHETGMHEGRFAFHPELGARIFSAIDRQVLKDIKAGTKRGEPEFVDRTFDYNQQAAEALGTLVSVANANIEAMSNAGSPVSGDSTNDAGTRDAPAGRGTGHGSESNEPSEPATAGGGADESPCAQATPAPSHTGEPGRSDERTDEVVRGGGAARVDDLDGTRAIEADISVIVDYITLTTGEFHDHSVCETSYGTVLPPASVQRLLCNGRVTPVILDANGNPFDLGRTVRHANRKQRRALRAIYRSCGFPGCDVGFSKCEMHHIRPWELGGLTDLANLIPMCSRHHHVIHEGGWQLHLAPDRTLTITQPNGQNYGTAQPDIRWVSPPGRTGKTSPFGQTDGATTTLVEHPSAQPAQTGHSPTQSPERLGHECEQMNLLAG